MYKHLTQYELYYIWLNCINSFIVKRPLEVAKVLNKHRSTIYRAINFIKKTNWTPSSSSISNSVYTRDKKRFKISKKRHEDIKSLLSIGWSPEVISGRLRKYNRYKISFKTIYNYIAEDRLNGGLLYKLLPHRGKRYKYCCATRSKIPNRIDISMRPKIIDKKLRIGDLEGDTIVGIRGGGRDCLMTLVDRVSKYCIIRHLPNKTALAVECAMNDSYNETLLPFITVTYDNGPEFTNHENISQNIGCDVYFARPYRSSDRGLNEHTNGLIRWFFPKKTDFANVTEEEVQYVQDLLNNRPRKSLNYLTPNEVLNRHLNKAYKKCRSLLYNGRLNLVYNNALLIILKGS